MALHLNANSPIYCRFVHKALIYSDSGEKRLLNASAKKIKRLSEQILCITAIYSRKDDCDDDTPFFCAN